jgi:hypothetical protein
LYNPSAHQEFKFLLSMSEIFAKLFFSFLLCQCIGAFPLVVENMDVLTLRKYYHNITLNLDLSELTLRAPDLEIAHISILMDARVCHKFDKYFYDVVVFLPQSCARKESFWFSIVISVGESLVSSLPIFVPHIFHIDTASAITFVLPLAANDAPRASLLLKSLQQITSEFVRELQIYAPHDELHSVMSFLHDFFLVLNFPVNVYSENLLLCDTDARSRAYPYAKQMAIKILVAATITTDFYLTLDADLILLREISYEDVIDNSGRAKYDHESRHVHAAWWRGSEEYLRVPAHPNDIGFGVTPAMLSTYGSLLARDRILSLYDGTSDDEAIGYWILSFGRDGVIWSEYTVYRVMLDHYHLFSGLHYPSMRNKLHCFDVWYVFDFPWDGFAAVHSGCLFSVIQSSTGVSAETLHSEFRSAAGLRAEGPNSTLAQHISSAH